MVALSVCFPPLLVADGGEDGLPWALGRDAGMEKSALVTEEGVLASNSMMKRLHRAPLSRGFISSTSSSL